MFGCVAEGAFLLKIHGYVRKVSPPSLFPEGQSPMVPVVVTFTAFICLLVMRVCERVCEVFITRDTMVNY